MKGFALVFLVVVLALTVPSLSQKYTLADSWSGAKFFENFDFFANRGDPTGGYVDYVTQDVAEANGLINITADVVYIYSEHTKVAQNPGRMSVRIQSKTTYNYGLFLFDLIHMPTGCANWPAIWTNGNGQWPNSGEIDIIEGKNVQTANQMTLHTNAGCTMANVTRKQTGKILSQNCDVGDKTQLRNEGCSTLSTSPNSFGIGFNNNKGGVYAMEWTSAGVGMWFFPRTSIPPDVTSGAPNPTSWQTPEASWIFGDNCPSAHFVNHHIILDNTFCGQWAGDDFTADGCPGKCNDYVKNNFTEFTQAYWGINYFKTFKAA